MAALINRKNEKGKRNTLIKMKYCECPKTLKFENGTISQKEVNDRRKILLKNIHPHFALIL